VLVALLFVALWTTAATAGAAEKPAPPLRPVRLVAPPFLTSAPFFVADELGLFAREGLDVEFVELPGSPSSLPALAQGQIEVAGMMVAPALFNLAGRGAQVKIVAARTYESKQGCIGAAIMARRGLPSEARLDTPATLRGLRLSTDRTGASYFYVGLFLDAAGLELDDLEVFDVPAPARIDAFRRGRLDIAPALEPTLTQLLDSGAAEIWVPGRELAPDFQYTFLLFGPTFLTEDRDAGRRFLRAYLAGVALYTDEGKSPRLVEILARRTHLDPDFLRRACWPATARDGRIDPGSLARYQTWARGQGLIDHQLDPAKLIDSSLLESLATGTGAAQ
jgi:NitT/TauT family transport system substrate-binding protein